MYSHKLVIWLLLLLVMSRIRRICVYMFNIQIYVGEAFVSISWMCKSLFMYKNIVNKSHRFSSFTSMIKIIETTS